MSDSESVLLFTIQASPAPPNSHLPSSFILTDRRSSSITEYHPQNHPGAGPPQWHACHLSRCSGNFYRNDLKRLGECKSIFEASLARSGQVETSALGSAPNQDTDTVKNLLDTNRAMPETPLLTEPPLPSQVIFTAPDATSPALFPLPSS